MGIINITPGQVGLVGVLPSIAYINTADTIAEVTTTGYLNKEVANGLQISLPCIAAVTTKATPTSQPQVGWYQVSHVGQDWSLVIGSNEVIALPDGQILVGNPSGIATAVAMIGDISINNTGLTTIGAAAIDLAMLSAGIAPAYIVKFGGKDVSVGGSATVTIAAVGVVATDLAFAAIQASANAVNIETVTAGTDEVVVVCSADPGAATICWTAERVAS